MPAYAVQVRDKGRVRIVEVTAPSAAVARQQAKRFGTILNIAQRRRAGSSGPGMSVSDRYIFMVRLATMLASKVGATEALKLLRDSFGGRVAACAAGLLERVELGVDLPTAISEDKKNFPGAVGLIVKVGAQSGQTWRALQEAAEFERKIHSVRRDTGKGVVSGVLSFFVAGALMITSTLWIGPEIMQQDLMRDQADKVDLTLINAAAFWGGMSMIVIMVILFGFFWLATMGRQLFPETAERLIAKVPYYSDMVLAQDNYINLHRLSLLVRAGVRMEDALRTSFEGTRRGALKQDFGRALEALKKGQKWAAAMQTLHPTDRAALMLASDREMIATNLENIGTQYQSLYIQRISTFAPILQVVSAFAVTLAGLVLFGQSVLPMLQVSAGILQ